MLRVRRRPRRWNLPACLHVDLLRARIFSRSLDEVTLTITREIAPVHPKPTGVTAVRWSQGSMPRKYATHDTYTLIFPVHKLRQTELTKDIRSKWRLWPLRPAVCCTRGGADWPKVVAVGAQQPISDFFGFIQMRDTLSTNGEHHRVAEVKSFPAIPKSMRSVNGDQNGANLKKWSVLLVRTIAKLCSQPSASPHRAVFRLLRQTTEQLETVADVNWCKPYFEPAIWCSTQSKMHRDPSLYTDYGPRGPYWNHAFPIKLAWSELDQSISALARSTVTITFRWKEERLSRLLVQVGQKSVKVCRYTSSSKSVRSFKGKVQSFTVDSRNDPWVWKLV